jgi:GT2 family glycosyltransferase
MIDSMMIYRREAVEGVGGYRDVPRTDVDLGIRLRKAGWITRQVNMCFGLHMSQHTTAKKFLRREWTGGKGLGARGIAHTAKTDMISLWRTRKLRWAVAPGISILGACLGKKEDVRWM